MDESLTDWLIAAGGHSSLAIATSANGDRYAVASEWIGPRDCVLRVPSACLLTASAIEESNIARAIAHSGLVLDAQAVLAAHLLAARREPGWWRPYLDSIPTVAPRTPLFFTNDELRALHGSWLLPKALANRAALIAEWHRIQPRIDSLSPYSELDWLNARVIVTSRVFGLPADGGSHDSLVPMADIPNHRRPADAAWSYDRSTGAFEVTACRAFAPGEPVHISYGAKSNSRLLLHYGFCLADNDANDAVLRMPESDFTLTSCVGDGERAMDDAYSATAIARACEDALDTFPTSIADDEHLLAGGNLSANLRNCVLARLGEKRVLDAVRRRHAGERYAAGAMSVS
ncbi:MAG TPA: SET domain-containing histone-lysine N-methyltransferase [Gemmatimonadaceae bacterium]|jgi:histone-lysine N-methyltransferase SETD3